MYRFVKLNQNIKIFIVKTSIFLDFVYVFLFFLGDLATKVGNWPAAKRFCERSRGGCAPSLVRHDKTCFQWSPIDGTEMKISCEKWEVKMRFICEVMP